MFIVFEGGEACGKTTQISMLAKRLDQLNVPLVQTREPGGTPLAEHLRAIFKQPVVQSDEPTALTELHIVMAARAQHVEKVLRPALSAKKTILCDRFLDSSYVYQGIRGGLSLVEINQAAAPILLGLIPNVTFILSIDLLETQKRLSARQGNSIAEDRLDNSNSTALQLISDGYLRIVSAQQPYPCGNVPRRIVVDASAPKDIVHQFIFDELSKLPEFFATKRNG
jgi:dTMP kinase